MAERNDDNLGRLARDPNAFLTERPEWDVGITVEDLTALLRRVWEEQRDLVRAADRGRLPRRPVDQGAAPVRGGEPRPRGRRGMAPAGERWLISVGELRGIVMALQYIRYELAAGGLTRAELSAELQHAAVAIKSAPLAEGEDGEDHATNTR